MEPARILKMTVCGIDIANPPFFRFTSSETSGSGQYNGVVYDLIEMVSRQLDISIHLVRYPWNRCLMMLKKGHVDGVVGVSYLHERTEIGYYPTTATGEIDYSRIIYSNTYWLYTNDKSVIWDGNKLVLPRGGIAGTGLGYSSGNLLRSLGVELHQEYHPSALAALLLNRRISVIAGYAKEIEPFLSSQRIQTDDESAPVWKLPIPLNHDEMFLLVSKSFYMSYENVTESIWNLFGKLHRDGSYEDLFSRYQGESTR
jgi:polar amino acid transport system substrate-binding protein